MQKSNNIIISPLNWGLGHATRIIPIIEYCLQNDKNVVIVGNGESFKLLCDKFPTCKSEYLPSPKMTYGKRKAMGFKFAINAILLSFNVLGERRKLKKIIKLHNIDTIISDNRPGIYSKKVKSIYISHQINVFTKKENNFLSKFLTFLHKLVIKKYTYCFVPDYENSEFAGRMSKNNNSLNLIYVGILSRFQNFKNIKPKRDLKKYDILAIISGPEPQRSIFENIIVEQLKTENYSCLVIRGLPHEQTKRENLLNVDFCNHCCDDDFYFYVNNASLLISRSGYSSIMDIMNFNKNSIIVPTPAQPEQEYLAEKLNKKFKFVSLKQAELANVKLSAISFEQNDTAINNSISLDKILQKYI